jgi:hypothetical protein
MRRRARSTDGVPGRRRAPVRGPRPRAGRGAAGRARGGGPVRTGRGRVRRRPRPRRGDPATGREGRSLAGGRLAPARGWGRGGRRRRGRERAGPRRGPRRDRPTLVPPHLGSGRGRRRRAAVARDPGSARRAGPRRRARGHGRLGGRPRLRLRAPDGPPRARPRRSPDPRPALSLCPHGSRLRLRRDGAAPATTAVGEARRDGRPSLGDRRCVRRARASQLTGVGGSAGA